MARHEKVIDNRVGWVNKHIREYVDTDGRKGHRWRGMDTLLLTTRGRRSGTPVRTALIYGLDGDDYLVVPSNGGAERHPAWYLNLVANPEVYVQVGADKFTARARTASPQEKPRLWETMAKIFPMYDSYQERTARDIPVVIISRVPD